MLYVIHKYYLQKKIYKSAQGRIQGGKEMHPPTSSNYIHYTVLKLHIHTQILTQCRVKVVKLGSLTRYICKQV